MKWTKVSKDQDYAIVVPGGMVLLTLYGEDDNPAMVFIPCPKPTAAEWIAEHQFDR